MAFTKSPATAEYVRTVKASLVAPSPLERFLEGMLELLPRRMIPVRLTAASEISVIDRERGAFRALDDNPRFEITYADPLAAGWYYLEGSVVRHNGSRKGRLIVERTATHKSESIEILVPTNLRGSIREVFYLPQGTKRLFWVPTENRGFLEQGPLLIHRISRMESFFRRTYRVLADNKKYRTLISYERATNPIRALANLTTLYQQSAALRLSRYTPSYVELYAEYAQRLADSPSRLASNQLTLTPQTQFSLILRIDQTAAHAFEQTISSIRKQNYTKWQLFLVVSAPTTSVDTPALKERTQSFDDPRIRLITFDKHTSDAEALNVGLSAADGDFVLHIQQGDLLLPNTLYEVAKVINQHPTVELVYTDNDSYDQSGTPCLPQFKPAWNPDLLRSYDYIYSPAFYKRSCLFELGGYRTGAQGALNWDLALRYAARTKRPMVAHLPLLLYRTRLVGPQPTARYSVSLPQCSRLDHAIGRKQLQEHVAPDSAVAIDGPENGVYHVHYPIPATPPSVSIIIPTKDNRKLLQACIDSLFKHLDYPNLEIIVIDNQTSDDESINYLSTIARHPLVSVIPYPHPFNWAAINNFAITKANGSVIILLNNDVEIISRGWIRELVSHAVRPTVGVVGAKLLYPDHSIQHAGVMLGIGGVAAHVHRFLDARESGYCYRANVVQNISAVTGACMAFRRDVHEAAGGFDERFAVAFNDIDFCLKVKRLGLNNIYSPRAELIHHESVSRGHNDTPEKAQIFAREFELMRRMWGADLSNDHSYNPNLTTEFGDFSLAPTMQRSHPARLNHAHL